MKLSKQQKYILICGFLVGQSWRGNNKEIIKPWLVFPRFYKAAIEQHQPDGPYILAGYAFAALVAIEIAAEFEKAGKQVLN